MQDDPFARAVHRAEAAEHARVEAVRHRRRGTVAKWSRTGFRIHFTVYLVISVMLVAIWLTTGAAFPWPIFPILGWGAGVAAHWSATRDLMEPSPSRQPAPAPVAAAPAPAPTPAAPAATPTPAAPAAPAASTAEEIGRLAKLHKAGALTDEEFTAAKASLLK